MPKTLKFQPGERPYIRLVFQHIPPLKNASIIFVHEEDENEHILFGFEINDQDKPLTATRRRLLDFAVPIPPNKKPGVYKLDRVYFETYGGKTVDGKYESTARFEVVPEVGFEPVVENVSVLTEDMWRTAKKIEDQSQ